MNPSKNNEKQEIIDEINETKEEQSTTNDTEEALSRIQEILKKIDETPKAKKILKEFDGQFKDVSIKDILETDEKLQEEILKVKKERKEYLDSLQRFKADFENYKKRAQKQEESNIRYSSERILSKVFEPIDDLSRIIGFAVNNKEEKVPLDGLEITYKKLVKILDEEGVSIIDPQPGDTFDPQFHEAICVDNSNKFRTNEIAQQFEKGYKIKDRVIRASKVMVSSEEENEKNNDQEKANK
ncbi:MAG: nucleotide exchange factor GrpE [Candidatus Heimdallarchaeota archaeon]